jgi:hypothetical protein
MMDLADITLTTPTSMTAWRSYFPCTDDSRCFVCNEQTHEFLLLEGVSADIWYMLVSKPGLPVWRLFLSDHDIALDDLSDFIAELADAGLVANPRFNLTPVATESQQTDHTADEARRLETEMKNWVEAKGRVYAVHWEMTYRCNEVCVHCFNPGAAHEKDEKPQRETQELTTDEARRLLDDMAAQGVFRLTLDGW